MISVTFQGFQGCFRTFKERSCGFQERSIEEFQRCSRGGFQTFLCTRGSEGISKGIKRFQKNLRGVSGGSGRFQGCFRGLKVLQRRILNPTDIHSEPS